MSKVPVVFRTTNPRAILSFSAEDVAAGVGIIQFMGAAANTDPSTDVYFLTTNSEFQSANNGAERLSTFSKDFDVTFNRSISIKGDTYLSVPIHCYAQTGNRTGNVTATLKKVSGSTVTTLGAATVSETVSGDSNHARTFVSIKWSLSRTSLRKNDKLRLSLSGAAGGGSGTTDDGIGYSPVGTQTGSVVLADNTAHFYNSSSRMSLFVPAEIPL